MATADFSKAPVRTRPVTRRPKPPTKAEAAMLGQLRKLTAAQRLGARTLIHSLANPPAPAPKMSPIIFDEPPLAVPVFLGDYPALHPHACIDDVLYTVEMLLGVIDDAAQVAKNEPIAITAQTAQHIIRSLTRFIGEKSFRAASMLPSPPRSAG